MLLKGQHSATKTAGLSNFRGVLAHRVPWIKDRVDALQNWKKVKVLSVALRDLRRWHQPGLLLIGDAAHVMSPTGGVGINAAIQDAIRTANLLKKSLKLDAFKLAA